MGSVMSSYYQISEATQVAVLNLLQDMRERKTDPTEWHFEQHISDIPKGENILSIQGEDGYNLLQQAIGYNCVELVKWILNYGCDVNWGACSLPLHIAALHGRKEIVELLLKHGASVDLEARMCFPGPHNKNCQLKTDNTVPEMDVSDENADQLQSAEHYAIDGDQLEILELLLGQKQDSWLPWHSKSPLLCLACKKGAKNCTRFLVAERSDEINQCYEDYYPIHQAAMQGIKFLEILLKCGADVLAKTATEQMTVLHVVLLCSKKSAKETSKTLIMLLNHGCHEVINEPDALGNTPLHALIVRHAREESQYGFSRETHRHWDKWDTEHMMRRLLQNGAGPSINLPGNSALSCVLKNIRDLHFRYELLETLLKNGGDPNMVGLDGFEPLIVCLLPLVEKEPLQFLSHYKKRFYLNSVLVLCKYGANPNCSTTNNLTPLHILVFTASSFIPISEELRNQGFDFILKLLVILLNHGLEPNVQFPEGNKCIPSDLSKNSYLRNCGLGPNSKLSQLFEQVHQTLMDMVA